MSMVATAEPNNTPPRVRIEIDVDNVGDTFATLPLTRNGVPTRLQPPVGGSESVVFDYDAPYETLLTYAVSGTVLPAAGASWTENWANLAAWSGGTASWAVASGHATTVSTSAVIERSAGGPIGKISVHDADLLIVRALTAGGVEVAKMQVAASHTSSPSGGHSWVSVSLTTADGVDALSLSADAIPDFDLTFSDGVVRAAATDGGGWSLENTYSGSPEKVSLQKASGGPIDTGTTSVGQIAVSPSVEPESFFASDQLTLDVDGAWLIHPSNPDLSIEIDAGPDGPCCGPGCAADDDTVIYLDPESEDTVMYATSTTVHDVVGSSKPIPVSSGRRKAGVWTMFLQTCNLVARDAILAILDDQQPLLLQLAPSLGYDLPNGWYDIGDVSEARLIADLTKPQRRVTLPMQPVAEPSELASFGHTWADLLTEGLTWQGVLDTYGTWLNVLTGEPL